MKFTLQLRPQNNEVVFHIEVVLILELGYDIGELNCEVLQFQVRFPARLLFMSCISAGC